MNGPKLNAHFQEVLLLFQIHSHVAGVNRYSKNVGSILKF